MAYNIYVENAQGESIVSFGESVRSRLMFSDLWKMHKQGKVKRTAGVCHLQEIYTLDNHVAVALLVGHIEKELEILKSYLDEPEGKYENQKDRFRCYEKNLDSWKNLMDEVLIFEVWDTS